jgi:hypothetical protein
MACKRLSVGVLGLALWAAQSPSVSPNVADFQKRVADYMHTRKSAISAVSSLKTTDSPEKLQEHQNNLAVAIRSARSTAAPGDVFTPPIAAEFRHVIQGALGAERVKKGVRDNQPSPLPPIHVNAAYPLNLPVQAMPPSLLKTLPELPKGLEYRIVGRTLILHDVEANLIVDYMNEAFT